MAIAENKLTAAGASGFVAPKKYNTKKRRKYTTKNLKLEQRQTFRIALPNGEYALISFHDYPSSAALDVEIISERGSIGDRETKTRLNSHAPHTHLVLSFYKVSGRKFNEVETEE